MPLKDQELPGQILIWVCQTNVSVEGINKKKKFMIKKKEIAGYIIYSIKYIKLFYNFII